MTAANVYEFDAIVQLTSIDADTKPSKKRNPLLLAIKQFVIATLEGVSDEESANRLRERVIYAAREDIPVEEGSHFIVDIIGLPVKDADTDELLGEIKDINTRGARDIYIVKTPHGEYMVPAVPAFIDRIDTDDAVYMRPIPGLLDGGAENV